MDANLANAPARRRDVPSGRRRAGRRSVTAQERRRNRPASVTVHALAGAAIVVSAFGVGAVVALNGGGSADRATQGARIPAQEIEKGRSAAARSANAAHPATTTRSLIAPAPTAVLDAYWQNVNRHAFADAYAQLLPGSQNITEAQFVATEKQIKIQSASFRASVTSRTSSRAKVVVGSLITRDQRFGCQTWSGSYGLIETAGRWRIAQAAITPQPCVS